MHVAGLTLFHNQGAMEEVLGVRGEAKTLASGAVKIQNTKYNDRYSKYVQHDGT